MSLKPATRPIGVDESDAILAELVERFVDRLQGGERLDPRAFADQHPEHADSLLELLPAAATMARLRRSSLRADGPAAHYRLDSDAIGGYRIIREVGRGGMGVVFEAERASDGLRVALKVLPASASTDPRPIERFRLEGQVVAALDHPNIVPIYDVGCERGVHYYAMRFVDGCSLATLVREACSGDSPSSLTHREAARLALDAAGALAHAHELGIVHRDVKPANLLLDSAGHLWVADFGLARFLDGGDLTQTGDVIGTLRYLSPEQAKGLRNLGPRTDVYSLGATLYELATLRPAFDGHDRQELLRQIVSDEPTPPRKLDPTIPRDLETILASAMAKESEDRYASAGEFADDLRRFLDGRPILARRPDAPTRLARWARRNRGGVTIAVAVLALFLLGAGVGVALLWREQVRTRENLRVALTALDEFCLSTTGIELTRDPERTQAVQDLQLRALTIYERMLRQNPGDPEARWAAARAEHRVAKILARSPRSAESEPAFQAAHQNLTLLLSEDPRRLEYRRESADLLTHWGASLPAGKLETRTLRRRALAQHLRLASEFPGDATYLRAVARDSLEVAQSIGIIKPAEAVEKEQLFRRAVEIRQELADGSFDGKSELAEALAFLGHLLNATRRLDEGGEVMARGRAILAGLEADSAGEPIRRHRVVGLDRLFTMPRYCDPSPDPDQTVQVYRSVVVGEARLVAEFPFIPQFRADLAWGHHCLAGTFRRFDRKAEAEASERSAVGMLEELIRDHPTVVHFRREAAMAFEALGQVLEQSDRPVEALAPYRRAIEVYPESDRLRARIAPKLQASDTPTQDPSPAKRP